MKKIKYINLEIIDICNLKCKICDIWKNKEKNTLEKNDIENILSSKKIEKNVDITITGGEPLLHPEIKLLFKTINKLGFKVNTLSTNGTIYDKLKELLNFCKKNNIILPNIHISIDGLEKTHDFQRGSKGNFKKTIETIIKLKKNFKNINIKIKYTIHNNNITDIIKVYILSKKLGVNISFKIIENDIFYTNKTKKPQLLIDVEKKKKIINTLQIIYKQKNKYINNLIYYLKNNKLNFKCTTPQENIFIMANGDIFPCTKYKSIGNIKNKKIDGILFKSKHMKLIKIINKNNCSKCFSFHGSYKSII